MAGFFIFPCPRFKPWAKFKPGRFFYWTLMESSAACIRGIINNILHSKNRLMTYRTFINRSIILGFMV
jgi:hypothetical protein